MSTPHRPINQSARRVRLFRDALNADIFKVFSCPRFEPVPGASDAAGLFPGMILRRPKPRTDVESPPISCYIEMKFFQVRFRATRGEKGFLFFDRRGGVFFFAARAGRTGDWVYERQLVPIFFVFAFSRRVAIAGHGVDAVMRVADAGPWVYRSSRRAPYS